MWKNMLQSRKIKTFLAYIQNGIFVQLIFSNIRKAGSEFMGRLMELNAGKL